MTIDIILWKNMKYSLYSTLIFLFLLNPVTQAAIKSLVVVSSPGVEYLFHGLLFFCMMLGLLMFIKT